MSAAGHVLMPLLAQRAVQVVPRLNIVGPHVQRSLEGGDGVARLVLLQQGQSKIVEGLAVVGFNSNARRKLAIASSTEPCCARTTPR